MRPKPRMQDEASIRGRCSVTRAVLPALLTALLLLAAAACGASRGGRRQEEGEDRQAGR